MFHKRGKATIASVATVTVPHGATESFKPFGLERPDQSILDLAGRFRVPSSDVLMTLHQPS